MYLLEIPKTKHTYNKWQKKIANQYGLLPSDSKLAIYVGLGRDKMLTNINDDVNEVKNVNNKTFFENS